MATRLALSIDKDYLPVQYCIGDRGNRGFQLDIAHEKHEMSGWIPKSWRFVQMGGESGKITMAVAAEVRELVVNSPFDDSRFAPEFPEDTLLYDGQTKGNYLVRDGQRTPVEADLDGNIIGSRTLRTRGRTGAALLAGLLSVLVLGLLWRKSARGRPQPYAEPGADSEVIGG